ncbi:MAG: hypothetical protein RID91_22020 [Azospirillaceae bacterium]
MLAALGLAGCASPPEAVEPAYVATRPYVAMPCDAALQELGYVQDLEARLTAAQRAKRRGDALLVASGFLVLPLLFIGGDDEQTYDLARVKGERQVLRAVVLSKECTFPWR